MLTIVTGNYAYAVEIHRDGSSIGTIRWENNNWKLMLPAPDGYVEIPWDVIELVTQFKASRTNLGG